MNNQPYNWINSLRFFATLGVIIIHVISPALYHFEKPVEWWIGNIYDSFFRCCVPIFLMISGFLILSKDYDNIFVYLKKRVLRIIYPFLFWSIIYIIYELKNWKQFNILIVIELVYKNLQEGALYHLWYIYMLIGLYMFFPIIGKWLKHCNKREIEYFLMIWLITLFSSFSFVNKLIPNIDLTYFSGYIGYPVLGYYLTTYKLTLKKSSLIGLCLFVVGIVSTMFGTYIGTKHTGKFYNEFYNYLTPNIAFASLGIFLIFQNSINYKSKLVTFCSKYSFGTYLIHLLVLIYLKDLGIFYNFINPLWGTLITSIICFTISTILVYLINKLPFGKYISGAA